jgi:2,4-didehydro-3-deoxy-L-rhamnonate hydrolase
MVSDETVRSGGLLFFKAGSALIGPSEDVKLRFLDRRNDHEIELAVVIGKKADRVSEDEALNYVAGYAVFLDMTLRGPEIQAQRKSIDTYAVLGPWLTTTDEIDDPDNLDMVLHVNDKLRQSGNTRDQIRSQRNIIAYASQFFTLRPGDVIFTGTPHGIGPVRPGDVIRAAIDGLGEMTVKVTSA